MADRANANAGAGNQSDLSRQLSEEVAAISQIRSILGDDKASRPPAEKSFRLPLTEVFALLPEAHIRIAPSDSELEREVTFTMDDLYERLAKGKLSVTVAQLAYFMPSHLIEHAAFEDTETVVNLPLMKVITAIGPAALTKHTPYKVRQYDIADLPDPFQPPQQAGAEPETPTASDEPEAVTPAEEIKEPVVEGQAEDIPAQEATDDIQVATPPTEGTTPPDETAPTPPDEDTLAVEAVPAPPDEDTHTEEPATQRARAEGLPGTADALSAIDEIEAILGADQQAAPVSETSFPLPLRDAIGLMPENYIRSQPADTELTDTVTFTMDDLFERLTRGKLTVTVAQLAYFLPSHLVEHAAFEDTETVVSLPLAKVVTAIGPAALMRRTAPKTTKYDVEGLADPFETPEPGAAMPPPAVEQAPEPIASAEPVAEPVVEEPPPGVAPTEEPAAPAEKPVDVPPTVEPAAPVEEPVDLAPTVEPAAPAEEPVDLAPTVEPAAPAEEPVDLAPTVEPAAPAEEPVDLPPTVEPAIPMEEPVDLAPTVEPAASIEEGPLAEEVREKAVYKEVIAEEEEPDVTVGRAVHEREYPELPGNVNLNAATLHELLSLEGVTYPIAAKILEHRIRNGPFNTVFDLCDIPRIGRRTFKLITGMPFSQKHYHRRRRLASLLHLPIDKVSNLNTVADTLAAMTDFAGCVVSDRDGLLLAQSGAEEFAEAMSAVVPGMIRQIRESMDVVNVGHIDSVSVSIGHRMYTIIASPIVALTAIHEEDKITKKQLVLIRKVGHELTWLLSHRAYCGPPDKQK